MADILTFPPGKKAGDTGDRYTRSDIQRVGEYLGSVAMNDLADDGIDYAATFAAIDEARRYVGQRQLHDMAVRVLGFGFGPRPTDGGPAAA